MTWQLFNVRTQRSTLLETVIGWHAALLRMRAQVMRRVSEGKVKVPLIEAELFEAMCEQPTMRVSFRVAIGGSSRHKLWSPLTRDLKLASSHWSIGSVARLPLDKQVHIAIRIQKRQIEEARENQRIYIERCMKVLEAVKEKMCSCAIAAERSLKGAMSEIQELRGRVRNLEEARSFLTDNLKTLEKGTKKAMQPRPAAAKQTSEQALASQPAPADPPRKMRAASSRKAIVNKAVPMTPLIPSHVIRQIQPMNSSAVPANKEQADKQDAGLSQSRVQQVKHRSGTLWPGLTLQDVGLVLGWLTFADLDVLREVSKSMRENMETEVQIRLHVFHYNPDLYGFNKLRYSRHGRIKKPVNWASQIAERMCKFLQYFSGSVKEFSELHFEDTPCEVLENVTLASMLSHVPVLLAYFPTDGWSTTTARKRIIQALRSGVSYKFVDWQGKTTMEGVR